MSKEKCRHEQHRDLLQCGYEEIEDGIFCKYWVIERDGGLEINILYYNYSKYEDKTAESWCCEYARKRALMGYRPA